MAELSLRNVRKSFSGTEVIHDVNLDVESGAFVVFVGPSGCGKSTLLRMIAGLEEVTAGSISIDGRDVTNTDPAKRGIAMVFQSYALYPHMTVEENIGFPLEMAGISKEERKAEVQKAADILHLGPYLDRKPKALSGGQRQRVAIGRAIVRNPKIFLFDEPLSNLDAELRVRMRLEIARLHEEIGATMVYVTHDQVEAMTLATKIVVLRDGNIEQVGAPIELYNDPDNMFVAGFIGSPKMNFIPARVTGHSDNGAVLLTIPELDLEGLQVLPRDTAATLSGDIVVGVRPDCFSAEGAATPVNLVCEVTERLGNVTYMHARSTDVEGIVAELRGQPEIRAGETVSLSLDAERLMLFSKDGRRL
ncbi:ABC transporter ATP-binding protein [Martelella sp. FLE1502]